MCLCVHMCVHMCVCVCVCVCLCVCVCVCVCMTPCMARGEPAAHPKMPRPLTSESRSGLGAVARAETSTVGLCLCHAMRPMLPCVVCHATRYVVRRSSRPKAASVRTARRRILRSSPRIRSRICHASAVHTHTHMRTHTRTRTCSCSCTKHAHATHKSCTCACTNHAHATHKVESIASGSASPTARLLELSFSALSPGGAEVPATVVI